MRRVRIAACACVHVACLLSACNGAEGEQPILERSTRDPLHCEVVAELIDFGLTTPDDEDQRNNVIRLNGGALWVVRAAEGDVPRRPRLVVTPLHLSAEPGADVLVDEDGQHVAARELIALHGGGFAVLWIRGDAGPSGGLAYSLWFAAFDAAGASTVGARLVEGIEPGAGFVLRAAVSSSGNIAVLYRWHDGSTQLATLDQVGDPWGPTHAAPAYVHDLAAAPGGGFVLLGQETEPDASYRQELLFLKIEETSESRPEPVPVARLGAGRTLWETAAVLPLERGYLVAWTEVRHPSVPNHWDQTSGSYSIIWVRRLDEHGEPLAAAVALRAKRDSVADRRPVLAQFGELVATFWSRGAYNYGCELAEACSHHERGQFLLIDPDDLTPRSELVEVLRDPAFPNGSFYPQLGGLLGTELSVRDSEVLVTATLQDNDDVRYAPGFASLRCE